jgi:hypothetical protein
MVIAPIIVVTDILKLEDLKVRHAKNKKGNEETSP